MALLDGELKEEAEARAERHLIECDRCRRLFDQTQAESSGVAAALALLDVPSVASRQFARPPSMARRRTWGVSLQRAAVLIVCFAAAASATIPGSPVREWMGERLRPVAFPSTTGISGSEEEVYEERVEPVATGGVSVAPEDGRFQVVLNGASPDLQVRAVLTDSPRGGVLAFGEAGEARFATAAGRVEVRGATAGELHIEIPRTAESATVLVDGMTYLIKEGDQLRLTISAQDSAATEIYFRVQR